MLLVRQVAANAGDLATKIRSARRDRLAESLVVNQDAAMGTVWDSIERYDVDKDDFVSAAGEGIKKGDRIRFMHEGEIVENTVAEVTSRVPGSDGSGAIHVGLGDDPKFTITPNS